MELEKMFEQIHKKLQKIADVKSVFGEMIETKEKSIIPVNVIKYHLGGGTGKGTDLARIKSMTKDDANIEEPAENRPSSQVQEIAFT